MRMREYILSVLDGIGISETDKPNVLASIIELCVYNPELELSEIISGYASANKISQKSIEKLIEKHLNVYDKDKFKRICEYTGTTPITHKDALYDIAVTIGVRFTADLQKQ